MGDFAEEAINYILSLQSCTWDLEQWKCSKMNACHAGAPAILMTDPVIPIATLNDDICENPSGPWSIFSPRLTLVTWPMTWVTFIDLSATFLILLMKNRWCTFLLTFS